MKYRKKPVIIEAFKLGTDEHPNWFTNNNSCMIINRDQSGLALQADIKTLEGTMTANLGDFIIQGVKGEIYPCKPDIFEATYEKVEE